MFFFPRRQSGRALEAFDGDACEDPYSRWICGVLFATLPVVCGMMACVSQHAYCLGGKPTRIVEYYGTPAIALGIACVGLGAFLNGHYFWSGSRRYYLISQLLKPLSLLVIAGALGFFLVNEIIFS